MGITIHYKGKLNNLEQIYSVIDELKDISEIMSWKYSILDNDWNSQLTAQLFQTENGVKITGHLPLKGITINLHPECESFYVLFDKNGNLQSVSGMVLNPGEVESADSNFLFIKTQYAPPEIHIAIIKLLKYLKDKYISDLNVIDEGSYWVTEDQDLLIRKISFIKDKMDQVESIISSINNDFTQISEHETIELLEKILKEKLN